MMSIQQDLSEKIAVVTGAGRGLGRAIADVLADRGAHVIINDRTLEPATEVLLRPFGHAAGGRAPSPLTWRTRQRLRRLSVKFWVIIIAWTS